jgi:hypothetical protein
MYLAASGSPRRSADRAMVAETGRRTAGTEGILMPHLWEIDHPYYCNEGNYFAHESVGTNYDSWNDFLDEEGNSHLDLNLIFRWDWRKADKPDKEEWGLEHDTLLIFWMGQRKGLYRYSTIVVTDADESAIKEFLSKRWQHLKLLWQGISD